MAERTDTDPMDDHDDNDNSTVSRGRRPRRRQRKPLKSSVVDSMNHDKNTVVDDADDDKNNNNGVHGKTVGKENVVDKQLQRRQQQRSHGQQQSQGTEKENTNERIKRKQKMASKEESREEGSKRKGVSERQRDRDGDEEKKDSADERDGDARGPSSSTTTTTSSTSTTSTTAAASSHEPMSIRLLRKAIPQTPSGPFWKKKGKQALLKCVARASQEDCPDGEGLIVLVEHWQDLLSVCRTCVRHASTDEDSAVVVACVRVALHGIRSCLVVLDDDSQRLSVLKLLYHIISFTSATRSGRTGTTSSEARALHLAAFHTMGKLLKGFRCLSCDGNVRFETEIANDDWKSCFCPFPVPVLSGSSSLTELNLDHSDVHSIQPTLQLVRMVNRALLDVSKTLPNCISSKQSKSKVKIMPKVFFHFFGFFCKKLRGLGFAEFLLMCLLKCCFVLALFKILIHKPPPPDKKISQYAFYIGSK